MLSAIQLRSHHFTEISLTPIDSATDEERRIRRVVCRHRLALSQREGDSRFWLVRLRVELGQPKEGTRALYIGRIEVIGEFELHPETPETERQRIASYNGASILYGSIREWVSTLSSRSLNGMIELPTLDARSFLPNKAADKPKIKKSPKSAQSHAKE